MFYYLFHPLVGVPVIFILFFVFRARSAFSLALNILFLALLMIYLLYIPIWVNYGSYYFKYYYLVLLIGAGIYQYFSIRPKSKYKWMFYFFTTPKIGGIIYLVFKASLIFLSSYAGKYHTLDIASHPPFFFS